MAALEPDMRKRLGRLVHERRVTMSLSVAAAARAAGIDRGTWTGMEKGVRETEEYNYARIERVLGWKLGSIDAIVAGGQPEPAQLEAAANGSGEPDWAGDANALDQEIRMIQQSNLDPAVKRAMIQEAERLRERQRDELDALAERQAAERRRQVQTWLRLTRNAHPAAE